jgi:CRP-like cAMP-binding protein
MAFANGSAPGNGWPPASAGHVRLLDVDPDLGRTIPEARWPIAMQELVASVVKLPRGPLPAMAEEHRRSGSLGYLLVSGLLMREVTVAGRPSCELLGTGDVIRPWPRDSVELLARTVTWTAVEPTTLAELGGPLARRLGEWPEVVDLLVDRSIGRAHALALERAISSHVRVDVRLLAILWHLGERWGVVTLGGVRIVCPLTHATLARMVGARRPTVTTALQRLMRLGYLKRDRGAFVVVGDASSVEELEGRSPSREAAAIDGNGRPVAAAVSAA